MKEILLSIALMYISLSSMAINLEPDSSNYKERFYVGLSLTTVTYHIYYDDGEKLNDIKSGYFTPMNLHAGYNLTEKLRIQVGLGYGGSKDKLEWSLNHSENDTVQYKQFSKTNVLAMPVTAQMVFLKVFKRFPVYGTVSMIPSYGFTKAETQEIRSGVSTFSNESVNGVNLFTTAGLGMNYKISSKFYGYAEYLFYKRNLTGQNSFDYDWDQAASKGRRIFKSFGIGLNYNL